MEAIKTKQEAAQNALSRLEEIIAIMKEHASESMHAIHRDSLIMRLNFTYDALYKYVRVYLIDYLKIPIEEHASPRSIFKECAQAKKITAEELDTLLSIAEDRNKTSHLYNENVALSVAARIPGYAKMIRTIIDRLSQEK